MNLLWQQKLCNLQQLKIVVFTYLSPHFCLPSRRPCDYHAICCMDGKTIQCLPSPSQHVPTYLQYFPSYTMLNSMRKSKNRYFDHIFVSPGDAPGAITLNVVRMEREFDAYKLSRCMCPSNYYRFWDAARYWSKIVNFFIPLAFGAPVKGFPSEYRHPLWDGKTRIVSLPALPDGKKIRIYLYSFWCDPRTWQTDGQTDTGWHAAWPRLHRIAR